MCGQRSTSIPQQTIGIQLLRGNMFKFHKFLGIIQVIRKHSNYKTVQRETSLILQHS